jgi:hypothetical protein
MKTEKDVGTYINFVNKILRIKVSGLGSAQQAQKLQLVGAP